MVNSRASLVASIACAMFGTTFCRVPVPADERVVADDAAEPGHVGGIEQHGLEGAAVLPGLFDRLDHHRAGRKPLPERRQLAGVYPRGEHRRFLALGRGFRSAALLASRRIGRQERAPWQRRRDEGAAAPCQEIAPLRAQLLVVRCGHRADPFRPGLYSRVSASWVSAIPPPGPRSGWCRRLRGSAPAPTGTAQREPRGSVDAVVAGDDMGKGLARQQATSRVGRVGSVTGQLPDRTWSQRCWPGHRSGVSRHAAGPFHLRDALQVIGHAAQANLT